MLEMIGIDKKISVVGNLGMYIKKPNYNFRVTWLLLIVGTECNSALSGHLVIKISKP